MYKYILLYIYILNTYTYTYRYTHIMFLFTDWGERTTKILRETQVWNTYTYTYRYIHTNFWINYRLRRKNDQNTLRNWRIGVICWYRPWSCPVLPRYVCMYVCVCICVCVCVCLYEWSVDTGHGHVESFKGMYVCICTCMCACMYVCMSDLLIHVQSFQVMYVCVYIYTHKMDIVINSCIHIDIHTHRHNV